MPEREFLPAREKLRLTLRMPRRRRGFWFGLAIELIWPLLLGFTHTDWSGTEHLPARGGVLVASNHLSFSDPIVTVGYGLAAGRVPRCLAKASLWRVPVVRGVLGGGGHIPVDRDRPGDGDPYGRAVDAVEAGECVVFFPEGTYTSDPRRWPMRFRTGLARVALATGAPVIPLAHWGTDELLRPHTVLPRLLPRRTIHTHAGPPVDLGEFAGAEPTREVLDAASERIRADVTALVAAIRDKSPR